MDIKNASLLLLRNILFFLMASLVFSPTVVVHADEDAEEFLEEQREWQENIDEKLEEDDSGSVDLEKVKIDDDKESYEGVEEGGQYDVDLQDSSHADELKEKYEELEGITAIDRGLWYQDILRNAGYGGITLLVMLVDYLENGVDKILKLNHFYEHTGVKSLMDLLTPYVMGLFLVSLIVLGYKFMWNKIDKRGEVLTNVLLAFTLILVIPNMFTYLDDMLQIGLDELGDERGSLSEEILKSNTADLQVYLDANLVTADSSDNEYAGSTGLPPKPTARDDVTIGTSDLRNANNLTGTKLEINEKIDVQADEGWFRWTTEKWVNDLKDDKPLAYDFLRHRAKVKGDGEGLDIKRLAKNTIPGTMIGQESYYRYKLNWFTIYMSLAITAFVLAITIVKVGRVMFELGFHGIFGMFIAATDLTGGQRTKKVITEIVSSFAVLFVMVLILKLYIYYVNWALDMRPTVGVAPYILLLIAGAWVVIDAPDIVTRVLGIDAGLRSGYQAMMGAWAGSKLAGGVAKGTKDMASKTLGSVQGAGAFMRGASNRPKPIPPMPSNNQGGYSRPSQSSSTMYDLEGAIDKPGRSQTKNQNKNLKNNSSLRRNDSIKLMNSNNGHKDSFSENGNLEVGNDVQRTDKKEGGEHRLSRRENRNQRHNPKPLSSVQNAGIQSPSNKGSAQGQGFTDHQRLGTKLGENPNNNDYIHPREENPYEKYTIMGGSQRGQQRADFRARAYNSGRKFREKIEPALGRKKRNQPSIPPTPTPKRDLRNRDE